ncbi:hypothetical protein [uncultured Roseovarius sp.]|uniref:hypothetical protein n=1 Tax=uncultured Roseovarius sp. TaxID=293344 RepID=UPI0026227330|nr:hypothetical protein [uncultured Roseovarius sp.]
MAKKTIHFHLGPHKTGSTAIQRALRENAAVLSADFGLTNIKSPLIPKAAKFLNSDRTQDAVVALESVADLCADADGDCIISCEDFSGSIPGARGKRKLYPNLWTNLEVLENVFASYDRRYYFFLRQPAEWARSAYVQNLKHRQKFSRFDDFANFLNMDELWDDVISIPLRKLGKSFVIVEYPSATKQTAMRSLLAAIPGCAGKDLQTIVETTANQTANDKDIAVMEAINRSSATHEAKRRAKLSLFEPNDKRVPVAMSATSVWLETPDRPTDLPKALMPLWKRVEKRVATQDQPNLMPDLDVDLRSLRHRIVDADGDLPEISRGKMVNQAEILTFRFRGQTEVCFLLGLVISYLRRNTPHTQHAATLFQRLWKEEYKVLLGLLPTRWLISSFQTFLDHGINEHQKVIGSGAYFYANMLKAYEAERAFESMPPDAVYPDKMPKTKMGFAGLDRFKLGGSDLILNTNALLLELSAKDQVAGRVVCEFLARAKASKSIFSRMDKSRQAHGIDIKQFSNCWSFFDEP